MCSRLLTCLNTRSGLEICNECSKQIHNLLRLNKLKCNNNRTCETIFECHQCSFNQLRMLGVVSDTSNSASANVSSFDLYASKNSKYKKLGNLNMIKDLCKNQGIPEKEASFVWTRNELDKNFSYIFNCIKKDILSTDTLLYLEMYFFSFFCLLLGFRPGFNNLNGDEGFLQILTKDISLENNNLVKFHFYSKKSSRVQREIVLEPDISVKFQFLHNQKVKTQNFFLNLINMKCNEQNLRLYVNSIFPTLNFRLMRPYVTSCLAFYIYKAIKQKAAHDREFLEKTKLALKKNFSAEVAQTFDPVNSILIHSNNSNFYFYIDFMIIFKFLNIFLSYSDSTTIIVSLYQKKFGYGILIPHKYDQINFIYDQNNIIQTYLPKLTNV